MTKTIIITGASHGIGQATAEILAKENNLLLIARTESDLKKLKVQLSQFGHQIEYLSADITLEKDRQRIFDFTVKNFPSVDVLINNAGIYYQKQLIEADISQLDDVLNTNVLSLIKLTRLFAVRFVSQKSGQVINISSVAGLEGYDGVTIYCTSKFAVTGFSKALFEELRKSNVRVTTIYPDFVNTWGEAPTRALLKPEDVATVIKTAIDLPDYAVIQDLRLTAIDKFELKLE